MGQFKGDVTIFVVQSYMDLVYAAEYLRKMRNGVICYSMVIRDPSKNMCKCAE